MIPPMVTPTMAPVLRCELEGLFEEPGVPEEPVSGVLVVEEEERRFVLGLVPAGKC